MPKILSFICNYRKICRIFCFFNYVAAFSARRRGGVPVKLLRFYFEIRKIISIFVFSYIRLML